MSKYDHLLWVDLETTGTDEDLDSIIEIGVILTDMELNELDAMGVIVDPTDEALLRLGRNPVVSEMHKANGLLRDLETSVAYHRDTADTRVVEFLKFHGVKHHRVMLAGSGVSHFDRRFIKAQLPCTNAYLAYPCMDIGVVRRAWEMFSGAELPYAEPNKNHRALDDIRFHLEEARAFKALWRGFDV